MTDAARILFPDFREEQRDSRYPFVDTANLLATDGLTAIQRDTFIDAVFHIIGAGNRVYISSVKIESQKVTITLGDETTDAVAAATFAPSPIAATASGGLAIYDLLGRPAGTLVATKDNLSLFTGWSIGTYEFTREATEFVSTTVIPTREPGVRGLSPATKELITGDVWLIGDGGVTFRYGGVQDGKQIIRVDVTGVPLSNRFLCVPYERFQSKNFVRTINGCPPDEYGNFTITATGHEIDDTVLRVTQADGIIFIDAVGRKVV
jgi:hypothetical protein